MSFPIINKPYIIFICILAVSSAGCKNQKARTADIRPDSIIGVRVDSPWMGGEMDSLERAIPDDRPTLIAALKELGRKLRSGDKHQISSIFTFPISDTVAHFYVRDTSFDQEKLKNDTTVTAGMFYRYYAGIDQTVSFDEFAEVFRQLNMDKLMKTNGLEIRTDTITDPCTRKYRVEVEDDSTVRISYGVSAVNGDYRPADKKDAKEHADDYEEGACEHITFWVYAWNGKQLRLVRQDAAD